MEVILAIFELHFDATHWSVDQCRQGLLAVVLAFHALQCNDSDLPLVRFCSVFALLLAPLLVLRLVFA